MPKTFHKCDADTVNFCQAVMASHHPNLVEADITIDYLMTNELTHHGYPAYAVIRVMSLADRANGSSDARVTIDSDHWAELTTQERMALISHEFTHLQPILAKVSKDNPDAPKYKTDDLGRPKLKLRKHDYQIGGFYSNIENFQESSVDLHQLAAINKQLRERNLIQSKFWG